MAIDPVCGMDVDPKQASGKSDYQGQTFYFCSPNCVAQFDADPHRYAQATLAGRKGRCRLARPRPASTRPCHSSA